MLSSVFLLSRDGSLVSCKTMGREHQHKLVPAFLEALHTLSEKNDRVIEIGENFAVHLEINDVILLGIMSEEVPNRPYFRVVSSKHIRCSISSWIC